MWTKAYRANDIIRDKWHIDTNNWLERFNRTLKSHPEYLNRKKNSRMDDLVVVLIRILDDYTIKLARLKRHLGKKQMKRVTIVNKTMRAAWRLLKAGRVEVRNETKTLGTGLIVIQSNDELVPKREYPVSVVDVACICSSDDPGYCVHHFCYFLLVVKADINYYGTDHHSSAVCRVCKLSSSRRARKWHTNFI